MEVEAVLLAAGVGSRISSLGAKVGLPVGPYPLMLYPLRSLLAAGVTRLCVVTNHINRPLVEDILGQHLDSGVEVVLAENRYPERENGYSLYVCRELLRSEEFLVSMSDHIYPPDVPAVLLEAAEEEDALIVVAGDRDPRFVDVEEATLIRADGSSVVCVGKGLETWDYVDAGVFVMRREVFEILDRLAATRSVVRVSDLLNEAVSMGYRVLVADITGIPWTEVDTPEDYYELTRGPRQAVLETVMFSLGLQPEHARPRISLLA